MLFLACLYTSMISIFSLKKTPESFLELGTPEHIVEHETLIRTGIIALVRLIKV